MNTIRIYSPEFTLLHEFEDFISCKEQRNYAEASTIQLSVQPESTAAPYLLDGFYVCIDDWYYIIRDRIADTNRVSVVGYSPFKLLQQRVANEQTVSGSVDSMAKTLITANTQGNRSLPITCAAADNSGTQHTWTTEGNRVSYEIEDMLKLNDSGVKTKFIGDGFEFDTYHGADRSTENTEGNEPVIFAVKYDNLLSFSHETGNIDTVNVVYVTDDEGNVTEYDPERLSGVNRFEATTQKNTTEEEIVINTCLPDGYTEVEYIESDGNAYINTKITASTSLTAIIDFQFTEYISDTWCFSVFQSATVGWRAGVYQEAFYCQDLTPSQTNILERTTFTGTCKYNLSQPLFLFAENRNGTAYGKCKGRCFPSQIMSNGVFARNYVPCTKANGEAGLYDLVSASFFGNAGSGKFTAGPIVDRTTNVFVVSGSAAIVKPRDTITSTIAPYTFAYGADYFLGDIVTIEHKSMEAVKNGDEYDIAEITRRHAVRITSMAIDYTADTVTYTPTFGTVQRDLRTVIKKQQTDIISNQTAIKAINKRISALEAAI